MQTTARQIKTRKRASMSAAFNLGWDLSTSGETHQIEKIELAVSQRSPPI
jgi:hypothetical protein